MNFHHPCCRPSQRVVFMVKGFNYRTPLAVPLLVQPADYRLLHAVEFRSQIVAPVYLPLPPKTILLAYLPEYQSVSRTAGRQAGDSWEWELAEPSEWRQTISKRTCRFPPLCAIPC
jgi:hypothetical protein